MFSERRIQKANVDKKKKELKLHHQFLTVYLHSTLKFIRNSPVVAAAKQLATHIIDDGNKMLFLKSQNKKMSRTSKYRQRTDGQIKYDDKQE